MYSKTIDYLEKFDNQHDFERMASDILNAFGYKEVVLIAPRGGSDGGRDITFTTESGGKGLACVTLRKDIEVKFKQDFSQRKANEYEKYILFCTAHLTAKQKLDFINFCAGILQAELVPTDIEALRQGSNECDSFERLGQPKINPEAAQEAISEFIFHRLDCSKLSH